METTSPWQIIALLEAIEDQPRPPFTDIRETAVDASKIWFDKRRGNKRERYADATSRMQTLLTTDVIADSRFYQDVSPAEHLRILQLIAENLRMNREVRHVPDSDSEREIARSYLTGLWEHGVELKPTLSGETIRQGMRSTLKTLSPLPNEYMEFISPSVIRETFIIPSLPHAVSNTVFSKAENVQPDAISA